MQITQSTVKSIVNWLQGEFAKREKHIAVVGVSGGIDSAVVYKLCQAAGLDTWSLLMPYRTSSSECSERAERLTNAKNRIVVDITDIVGAYLVGEHDKILVGNFCARIRMALLYDWASTCGGLVVGTSNKSEVLLGYGTLHGDIACDIAPLFNLYKSEVRELAKLLDVPQEIIDATPTADLWQGQTDEGELGFSYAEADRYFQTGSCGIPEIDVKIFERVQATTFKREPVPAWSW